MSDLRFDPLAHRWVAIARNRQDRPMEFVPIEQTRQQLICPFCKGNEEETPPPIAAYHSNGTLLSHQDKPSSWTARVIPNKYPSFAAEAGHFGGPVSLDPGSLPSVPLDTVHPAVPAAIHQEGPYRSIQSGGRQELIVASPRHVSSLSDLDDVELQLSFKVYQDRLAFHRSAEQIEHSILFMNCRSSAGASLSHIHTQLIGTPIVSEQVAARRQRNIDYRAQHGTSLVNALACWEQSEQTRIVEESEHFTVFCPFASRFPFQVWIVPRKYSECFIDCPRDMRDELAVICRGLVQRMECLLDEPGYNLLLHQAPFSMSENDHWFFELFPRLTRPAGLEWGTEIWVNPVSPESAAKRYRID